MDTLLKRIRQRHGFKTPHAQETFGISQAHYTRIENGKNRTSETVAKKIAEFFGVPLTAIFNVECRYAAAPVEQGKSTEAA